MLLLENASVGMRIGFSLPLYLIIVSVSPAAQLATGKGVCMTRLNQDRQSGSFDQNRFDRHSFLLTPSK